MEVNCRPKTTTEAQPSPLGNMSVVQRFLATKSGKTGKARESTSGRDEKCSPPKGAIVKCKKGGKVDKDKCPKKEDEGCPQFKIDNCEKSKNFICNNRKYIVR